MQRVLDERCVSARYRLCAFRDQLPVSAEDYLWNGGVLQRTGGWRGSKSESWDLILAAAVTHPFLLASSAVRSSVQQFVRFRTGDDLDRSQIGSWVDAVIAKQFPHEYPRYRSAKQTRGTLSLEALATFHHRTALGAVLIVILALLRGRSEARKPWQSFAAFVALALVTNAIVAGALSGPHNRYQSRLIWLVVLVAASAILERFHRSSEPAVLHPTVE
jgi:hypothetical protein